MYALWQVNYYDVTLGGTNITYEDLNTNTITIAKVPYNNSLKIKVIPNSKYYFESYTCTNGYTISDLLVGSSYYETQEITINNPETILSGECSITMHARSYAATYNPKTCTGTNCYSCRSPYNCRSGASWRNETICDYKCSDGTIRDNVKSYQDSNGNWGGAGSGWESCDNYSYNCSYYTCPNGGTLSGTMCVF